MRTKTASKAPLISRHETDYGSVKSYVQGFVASICLTLTAYLLVVHRSFSSNAVLIGAIVVLAFSQFIIQLLFFLHLGKETKPRWRLMVFIFMIVVVSVLVGGSLWIMNNLNSNMKLTLPQQEQYMNNQDGL
jgi:cytochrome o ubiquinol oxidase operon protein cyoD